MTAPATTGKQAATTSTRWWPSRWTIPAWLRNPAGIAIVFAAVIGLFGILTLALDVGRPFGGHISYGFIGRPAVNLGAETPNWWPVMAQNDLLRYGDRLLSINGLPYLENARREMARAHRRGEDIDLLIERPGVDAPIALTLPLTTFTWHDFLDLKLPEMLVGLVFWLLAVIVLRARPGATINRVFAATTACIALHRLTAISTVWMDTRLLINLTKSAHMIVAGLCVALIFHMALIFPTPTKRKPVWTLRLLYSLGLFCGLVLAATRLPFWARIPDDLALSLDNVVFRLMMVLFLCSVIALFARLILAGRRGHMDRRDRRVVRIVLVGLTLAIPPIIFYLLPAVPWFNQQLAPFWQGLDLRYLLLAIPVAFALAIVRYQTFESPSPLFIFVIVLSLSALVAAVGVAVWRQAFATDVMPLPRPPFPVFFLSVLAASLFWSRQADWRGWFGRFLHRADHNYEAARSFGNRVMGQNDIRLLPPTIAQALVDELALERAAVWLWQPANGAYELAAAAGRQTPPPPPRLAPPGEAPRVRALRVAWASTPAWLREPAAAGLLELLIPLTAEGRPIGLLGLGRRWDEEIFDERDLAVVDLVGQQATLCLLAAAQVEELRGVPGRVAEAQERERHRLAGELHDTIQQFLGRLPFFLTVSRDMAASDPTGAAVLLDRCLTDVEEAAGLLRDIRANLAPNQLATSLVKPLEGLAAHAGRSGLVVHLHASPGLDEATTIATRHALYRVIQQALDNAAAHAEASEVTVMLAQQNGRILFTVVDDGVGSTPEARRAAQEGGSFGLQSMRARLETVGGEFVFDSAAGRGTTVSGWAPAADDQP